LVKPINIQNQLLKEMPPNIRTDEKLLPLTEKIYTNITNIGNLSIGFFLILKKDFI